MLNLKKTVVAVLALSSSAVFAGTMGPVCSAVNVTVPCESTAWDVGARALYLQPVFSGGGYSYGAVDDNNRYQDHPNSWGWGFMIEGSYHFETGSDANLNWYHFSRSGDKNYTVTNTISIGQIAPLTITNTFSGNISTDPKWDAVNLEFGQHVDYGEKKDIRFHGGVQYARIANTVTVAGTGVGTLTTPFGATSGTYTASFERKPTYNGFGPRIGADMGYAWGNGLGVYANGAMALLAGSSKYSHSWTDTIGNNAVTESASKSTIAPELEAKLGLSYDYAVAQGDLTLDLGWMWVNYWNVTQSVAGIGPVAIASEGDFGVQGLYFGLKWLGNVA